MVVIPKASVFFFMLRPIPPIPRIPRTLPWGSWPLGGEGLPGMVVSARVLCLDSCSVRVGDLPRHFPSRSVVMV